MYNSSKIVAKARTLYFAVLSLCMWFAFVCDCDCECASVSAHAFSWIVTTTSCLCYCRTIEYAIVRGVLFYTVYSSLLLLLLSPLLVFVFVVVSSCSFVHAIQCLWLMISLVVVTNRESQLGCYAVLLFIWLKMGDDLVLEREKTTRMFYAWRWKAFHPLNDVRSFFRVVAFIFR